MRKPIFGKPRSASGAFSLSRKLPKLQAPLSAAATARPRPHPQIGRPAGVVPASSQLGGTQSQMMAPSAAVAEPALPLPPVDPGDARCTRCQHGESMHPVRYACDKYPHPDPLQICGCEAETLEELCSRCGHKGRSHKPRHRCRDAACHCWAFE